MTTCPCPCLSLYLNSFSLACSLHLEMSLLFPLQHLPFLLVRPQTSPSLAKAESLASGEAPVVQAQRAIPAEPSTPWPCLSVFA